MEDNEEEDDAGCHTTTIANTSNQIVKWNQTVNNRMQIMCVTLFTCIFHCF